MGSTVTSCLLSDNLERNLENTLCFSSFKLTLFSCMLTACDDIHALLWSFPADKDTSTFSATHQDALCVWDLEA